MTDQFSDLKGLRILIVESDADNRLLYIHLLESVGAEVVAVASVQEALTILTQRPLDVLISDVVLPDEDGYVLLRRLRALEANANQYLPAVAVSGCMLKADETMALAAGFQKCLLKPIDLDQFVQTIAQVACSFRTQLSSTDLETSPYF